MHMGIQHSIYKDDGNNENDNDDDDDDTDDERNGE